eukprot:1203919-Pleurochrysis_carterae.AAC.2
MSIEQNATCVQINPRSVEPDGEAAHATRVAVQEKPLASETDPLREQLATLLSAPAADEEVNLAPRTKRCAIPRTLSAPHSLTSSPPARCSRSY